VGFADYRRMSQNCRGLPSRNPGRGKAEVPEPDDSHRVEWVLRGHFAEKMVRDHTAANKELTAIATELGAEVPKTLDTDHQKIYDQLEGNAFDQQYMRVMVEDHDQTVKLFRQQASSGNNLQLKQFAQKTLPTIEEHQKMAFDLTHRLSETAAR
jgi:Domain of unknown function (DUF4142)